MKSVEVKICGLTEPVEAAYLNESGADYAGFVFYPPSKRNITFEQAAEIMPLLDQKIRRVAVTVSPDRKLAEKIMEAGFDLIQIHKKPDRSVLEILNIPVWYAFNVSKPDEIEKQEAFLYELPEKLSSKITGIVIDGADFGSGKTFDWEKRDLRWRESRIFKERKLILAGGLTPGNVAEGIRIFQPDIVDVSSGVEKVYSVKRQPDIETDKGQPQIETDKDKTRVETASVQIRPETVKDKTRQEAVKDMTRPETVKDKTRQETAIVQTRPETASSHDGPETTSSQNGPETTSSQNGPETASSHNGPETTSVQNRTGKDPEKVKAFCRKAKQT